MNADGDTVRAAFDYLWSYADGPPIEAEGQRSDGLAALARLEAERDWYAEQHKDEATLHAATVAQRDTLAEALRRIAGNDYHEPSPEQIARAALAEAGLG